ncbi:phosphohistidine phosphatase SixA [Gelidibacter algens]|uniref:Phosphohistidine phosphatase SixA n=1 Tax=Gelidibacter algens TaxID=49280 RepID=A0A327SA63_9FLAO|nr:phosphoglycerate mutase family protein [Gelidibacter algens]RAJ24834.1 phosphohistidine phosphatase SixA [Gelidibacter algens]
MTRYLISICFTLISISSFAQKEPNSEVTTYFFIRHAEKDRSDTSEKDPHLTGEGHKRAQDWSIILQHIQFDAIYATNYYRTKETCQPTATKNNLEIITYNADTYFDSTFESATKGKTVLIVGHSNTIPEFVNAAIGSKKYEHIDDANNGNLYIVTLTEGRATDVVLTIN